MNPVNRAKASGEKWMAKYQERFQSKPRLAITNFQMGLQFSIPGTASQATSPASNHNHTHF
jgi:hypothetical protein